MQNPKTLKNFMTDQKFKKLVDWRVKIDFLKDQISKLEQLKNFPIFAIAAFLLKCQIIEFELKQIIFSLELHLYSQTTSKNFRRKVRTPKDLDNLTLRKLIRELDQFIRPTDPSFIVGIKGKEKNKKDILNNLKETLGRIVDKRDEFTHRLFSLGKDTKTLIAQAEKGINDTNKALELLENIEEELKKL